jgi:O-antigen biosynthesis protein
MKVSIFTPTHNTEHLLHLYQSIQSQAFFEWVIVPNHGAVVSLPEDSRIKVFPYEGERFIGAIKNYACSKCEGDILLEVDHDDLLTINAIEKVKEAFSDPEIGFVYSNAAQFKENYEPTTPFNPVYGWQYRPFQYQGRTLNECLSFPATPASLSRIWYAPDHLRAWRSDVYRAVGGHDAGMRVLDDQDLIARTYLHTKFHHIDECLYLYRVTGSNTWLELNAEIQSNTERVGDKYLLATCEKWARENGGGCVNLGGRFESIPGFGSVDLKDADIITDLNEPWPFDDGSLGVIRACDVIEHLRNPLHTMKEAYRCLAPGGYFLIQVPSTDGRGAFQDPTHVSFWNENSFLYYTNADFAHWIDTPVKFQPLKLTTTEKDSRQVCWTIAHLVALKGGERVPGILEI